MMTPYAGKISAEITDFVAIQKCRVVVAGPVWAGTRDSVKRRSV
jgi:hypothetical protein